VGAKILCRTLHDRLPVRRDSKGKHSVNFDRGTLRVIRKGGKPQYVPLNPEALACIEEEVKFRTERFGKKPGADEPLFTNRYGRRYKKIRGPLKTACAKA
jgi:site-specific recombinase XerC